MPKQLQLPQYHFLAWMEKMVFKVLVFFAFLNQNPRKVDFLFFLKIFNFFCINFALKPLFFIIILFSIYMNLHSL